ncbi:MAG: CDP-diacylglycerol--glycerol-3-phosphate 3-phosphatidyltransferase [Boseongicola sp. SB0675_bin_26]|nr:CDP-diacylglycerol--glycerol-3-phosphate 3-phosphatidyltransferase [Boseongicola sp. SB0675_bin_26]
MTFTIPNVLTLLRLLAAPGVGVMFLYFARPWADWLAFFLFVGAAVTDFIDGYLARRWKQETRFGSMLDPIADKAMVVIALLVITAQSGLNAWILLPATAIVFREIFVSGLREFLGDAAGVLTVTWVAKLKTAAQMIAIAVLFASGAFFHMSEGAAGGYAPQAEQLVRIAADGTWWVGVALLWVAAVLTLVSGIDYFRKGLPYLRDGQ